MASSVAAPTGVVGGHPLAKWTRVAVLGFVLIAAGMALWIVGGLVAGQALVGEEVMFFAGAIVASLIAAGCVWRFGTAGKAVGIVLALAMMVMLFWVAFSLGAPGSFVEFSGAVMFVVGSFTALGYSIGGIVRRKDLHTEATRGETRAMRVMLGIVTLAMLVSAAMNLTMRSSVDAAAAAGAVQVTQASFEFGQPTYEAVAGETTKFLVSNSDAFTHDFAVPALGVTSGLITAGSEKLVEINAPAAGTYTIYCTLHADKSVKDAKEAGMAATLIVK